MAMPTPCLLRAWGETVRIKANANVAPAFNAWQMHGEW